MTGRERQAELREAARKTGEQDRARRQNQARIVAVVTVLLVAVALVALVMTGGESRPSGTVATADGAARTTAPPWPPQPAGLDERLAPFGFPAVGDESYHAHALLTVYRNGTQVEVPADNGFDLRGGHSSLHTHTADGVIHMEADDPYPYELTHVFAAWGVAFGRDRLGGDVADEDNELFIYVNGEEAPPGPVVLNDGDSIVVAYGEPGSFPIEPPTTALQTA